MSKIKLDHWQRKFLTSLENDGKSFNTIKNYRTDLNIFNKFLTQKGRELALNEITFQEVTEYQSYLDNKYSSPNSKRRRIQALRIFCDYLIQNSLLNENPIKKMVISPKVVDLPRPTPFHIVQKLFQSLEGQIEINHGYEKLLAQRNFLLLTLIYGGGLKVSDIERLNESHLSLTKTGIRILITPDKRDPYTVQISDSYMSYFKDYLQHLEQTKNDSNIDFANLFFNGNPFKILSGGLSARGIEIIFKELSGRIEHQVTAKTLRQSCIFKWLCQNVQQSRVKEWMGVQPQYSLKPYLDLLESTPEKYSFMDIA